MKMYAVDMWRQSYGTDTIITMANNKEEALEKFIKNGHTHLQHRSQRRKIKLNDLFEYNEDEIIRIEYIE